jgi:aspartyl-tRNA(Asn)/glutamyl-tRNA(Gln) amidotransferase subunit A
VGGLPVGLQIVGRYFDEATVLRIGHAFEAVSPMKGRWPPEVA